MALVDALYEMVRQATGDDSIDLKYNKRHIGFGRRGRSDLILGLNPRKSGKVMASFRVPRTEELMTRLEDSGLDIATGYRPNRTWIRLSNADLALHSPTLRELIRTAAKLPPVPDSDSSDFSWRRVVAP
jgi:hypothetical protein